MRQNRRKAAVILMILLAAIRMPLCSLPAYAAETAAESDSPFSVTEGFEQVSVKDFAGTVTIRSGEEYGVMYEGEEAMRPSLSCEDKVLTIEGMPAEETAEQPSETELPAEELCSLVIMIPAGTRLETVSTERTGTVILTDVTVGSAVLKNTEGDIFCKNVSLSKGEMYSETGNIQISEGAFHNLYLDCRQGSVFVSGPEGLARCRVAASADKGTVTVSGSVKGKTFRQNGNGKRYLTVNAGEGNVVILY